MRLDARILAVVMAMLFGVVAQASFDGPAPLAWRWAQRSIAPPKGAPQVDGNVLYVAVGSRVYAIERTSGNQLWRFPVGEPLAANFRTGCAVSGELVIAAADNRNVFGVDKRSGELVWQFFATDSVIGSPRVVGDVVMVQIAGGDLVALDLETGEELYAEPWSPEFESEFELLNPTMSTWQDTLIITTSANRMYSVDPVTRNINWRRQFVSLSSLAEAVEFGDALYLVSDRFVIALRGSTGGTLWQRSVREELAWAPAVNANGVVVVSRAGNVFALNLEGNFTFEGSIQLDSPPVAGPAFADETVAIPTSNGAINLVNPLIGEQVWSFTTVPIAEQDATATNTTAGGPGGPGGGGAFGGPPPGVGGGAFGGQSAPGGPGGGNTGTTRTSRQLGVDYVVAAGPAVLADTTLLLLTTDGSVFAFDETTGVDLTPPSVDMLFPSPGDEVSGQPPLTLVFEMADWSTGIDPSSIRVSVGETEFVPLVRPDGRVYIQFTNTGANRPLANGRAPIVFEVADYLGNVGRYTFALQIDNTLPPIRLPGRDDPDAAGGGEGGAARGGPGGATGAGGG